MGNYLNMYSPRLAGLGDYLRELTKKKIPFVMDPKHPEAFDTIKKEIISAHTLKYYDPSKPLTLQTDESLKGLDAVLLQEGHPIYFASKSLKTHQKPHVAIDSESLVFAWAMEKKHLFLAKDFSLKQTKIHLKMC